MKRFQTLLLTLVCPLALFAQSVGNIVINKTDNTSETYKLEDVGQMKYTTEEIQLFLGNDMLKPAVTIKIDDISSIHVQQNYDLSLPQIILQNEKSLEIIPA